MAYRVEFRFHLLAVLILLLSSCGSTATNSQDTDEDARRRIEAAKLDLWSRGAFDLDEDSVCPGEDLNKVAEAFEKKVGLAPIRHGPIRTVRRDVSSRHNNCDDLGFCGALRFRGGSADTSYESQLETKIEELGKRFGQDFLNAIEENKKDHREDCRKSCELFYCAKPDAPQVPIEEILNETSIVSYSMGAVPPEDFADLFGFPLDLIKVTQNNPLFSAEEAASVVRNAEAEGVDKNEYKSGKYRLGGDWLDNLPETRKWFNGRLESTFFPLLTNLFPEIISSEAVLRAHSVSLLKYNTSHPRTDVHIDNGVLAMTLAMTPKDQYAGGGTYFEHMGVDNVLPMDVGHATLRPGSVRHGGHRVSSGTRYILGAFLLLEDKVEHVRRLKNRGSAIRKTGDLDGAAKHFEWALALNPKCTTCMKDWVEILHTQKQFDEAEKMIRRALALLENKDSDALFTLGMILSELGRDDESISAYQQSLSINAEDAELCYNLGLKLGAKGRTKEEMQLYAQATKVDPSFGGAWLNWGTALAEGGNFDDAELMFQKAATCEGEVAPKAMLNLGLIEISRGNKLASSGDVAGAKASALAATEYLETAKPLLDKLAASGESSNDIGKYIAQFKPLRLQCHRLLGQVYAGLQEFAACEGEFRKATENFPEDPSAWHMLARVLEVQGKTEDASEIMRKVNSLRSAASMFGNS